MWNERVAPLPESDRLPFNEARDALYRELMNTRLAEATNDAMREMREAAYIERHIHLRL